MPYHLDIFGAQLLGQRALQEDNYLIVPLNESEVASGPAEAALIAFADGMGGHAAGDLASLVAVKTLVQSFLAQSQPFQNMPTVFANALKQVNEAIQEVAAQKLSNQGMGCTLLGVAIQADQLWWMSVGDSRLYLFRAGKLLQKNEDHSYGGYLQIMQAQGVALDAAALNGPKSMLFSALTGGAIERVDLPQTPLRLQAHDRLIVASDGLDTIDSATIIRCLQNNTIAQTAVNALLEAVTQARKPNQDNTTIIVIDIHTDIPKPAWRPLLVTAQSTREKKRRVILGVVFLLILGGLLAGGWYADHLRALLLQKKSATLPENAAELTISTILQGFPCSQLTVQGSNALRVSGYVASEADQQQLPQAFMALNGVNTVDITRVQVLPPPLCQLLERLQLSQNQAAERAVYLNLAGHSEIFQQDEPLIIEVTTPEEQPVYLYVDYYQNDGTVIHLLPSTAYPAQVYAPASRVSIGRETAGQVRIAPPFGLDMIVVMANPQPLLAAPRPLQEPYADYQAALGELPSTLSSTYIMIKTLPAVTGQP